MEFSWPVVAQPYKVLFLDIDGVTATRRSYRTTLLTPGNPKDVRDKDYPSFEEKAVANLNSVLKATGAKIVLSSTWRKLYSPESMTLILKQEGVEGELVGFTPVGSFSNALRGKEIQQWLDENPRPESYVIVDDDTWDIRDFHPDRFVHVAAGWEGPGLLRAHAKEMIEILRRPL